MKKLIVFSGASGSGKSTLLKMLLQHKPSEFGFSVSHTTRRPRTGEMEGVDYHYTSTEEFLKMKEDGLFIETAQFSGHLYGTSKASVQKVLETRHCLLDVDLQGVLSIRRSALFSASPSGCEQRLLDRAASDEESGRNNSVETDLEKSSRTDGGSRRSARALYVYVEAPSLEELKRRLVSRNTESEQAIQMRLQTAERDMRAIRESSEPLFDVVVVNGSDVRKTFEDLQRHLVRNLD